MRCQRCDQRDRRPVRRAKLAERDAKVALVDVPMQECPACGERWLDASKSYSPPFSPATSRSPPGTSTQPMFPRPDTADAAPTGGARQL